MATKKPTPPGAAPTTPAPAAPAPITALHWVGPAWLPELGATDQSLAAMEGQGQAVYDQAVATGLYRATTRHIRDLGLPDPAVERSSHPKSVTRDVPADAGTDPGTDAPAAATAETEEPHV